MRIEKVVHAIQIALQLQGTLKKMENESIISSLADTAPVIASMDTIECKTDAASKGVHLNSISEDLLSMIKCFQLIEKSTTSSATMGIINNNYQNNQIDAIFATNVLTKLCSEAEHWLPPDNYPLHSSISSFWLQSWLAGKMPPLRCNAYNGKVVNFQHKNDNDNNNCDDNINRCLNHTNIINGYCIKSHKCLSKNLDNCELKRSSSVVKFCDLHRCKNNLFHTSDQECKNEKLSNSDFCDFHSCSCCIQSGADYIGMIDPLCMYIFIYIY
jgi:hypothetical protein